MHKGKATANMQRYFIPSIQCDLTDELAEGLLRTVINNGTKVYADSSDYDAMAEIYWASSLSLGIEWTVEFFKSLNMPVTISELGVSPTDEEIKALALDATANDQMKLSRIRPLDVKAVEEIYKAALSFI